MKLLIFGATGGTGKELLRQGLAAGCDITVYVRNPAAIDIKNDRLSIVAGELHDYTAMKMAMAGHDAVISALGNKTSVAMRQSNTVISDALKNILQAMHENNVSRLIFITSFGVSDNIFLPEKLFIKIFLKNIFADLPLQESLIKQSGIAWTVVRPARLVDGPRTGRYRTRENLPIGLFSKISRADVADVILKSLDDQTTVRKILTISY